MTRQPVVLMCLQKTPLMQSFYEKFSCDVLDAGALQGTNRYCEDAAAEILFHQMQAYPLTAIHLLGSGNYHYLSALWTKRIDRPYQLLVYDHHTDMQPPAFGDILSCGGWLLKAVETQPFLQRVILAGPDAFSYEQTPPGAREKVSFISQEQLSVPDGSGWQNICAGLSQELPLYLSIDMDILGRSWAHTGWSQGEAALEQLIASVTEVLKLHTMRGGELLGADICGDAENADPDINGVNEASGKALVSLLLRYFKK